MLSNASSHWPQAMEFLGLENSDRKTMLKADAISAAFIVFMNSVNTYVLRTRKAEQIGCKKFSVLTQEGAQNVGAKIQKYVQDPSAVGAICDKMSAAMTLCQTEDNRLKKAINSRQYKLRNRERVKEDGMLQVGDRYLNNRSWDGIDFATPGPITPDDMHEIANTILWSGWIKIAV